MVLTKLLVPRDINDGNIIAKKREPQIGGHPPFLFLLQTVGVNPCQGFYQRRLPMVDMAGHAEDKMVGDGAICHDGSVCSHSFECLNDKLKLVVIDGTAIQQDGIFLDPADDRRPERASGSVQAGRLAGRTW